MAMLLKEVPEMRATINLVPSLLMQLPAYTDEGHEDTHLRVSRLPADGLSEDDANYLLDNFFMVHPDQMIRPFPRYHELYQKRGLSVDSAEKARKRFNKNDTHRPAVLVEPGVDPSAGLRAGRRAGRVPRQGPRLDGRREAVAAGQADGAAAPGRAAASRAARSRPDRADHHAVLSSDPAAAVGQAAGAPGHAQRGAAEASRRLRRGRRRSTSAGRSSFTRSSSGKSRGACGPRKARSARTSCRSIAEAGIQWIGTDEEILSCSTDGWVSRDGNGYLRNPEMLYRPWRVEEQGQSLQIVFRDHAMSDQIGFHYQRYAPAARGRRFRRQAGGHRQRHGRQRRPSAHAGEHHSRRRELLGILSQRRRGFLRGAVSPGGASIRRSSRCAMADYLARYPATDKIGHLFPGSWIQHNFGIWIGHPECNRAWDLLYETRQHLTAVDGAEVEAGRKAGPGLGGTVHRRGERLVLVVRRQPQQRPERAVRPAVPQASAKRLHRAGRAAADRAGPAHPPGTRQRELPQRADRLAARQGRRAADAISSGSTPGTTSAAARGGP